MKTIETPKRLMPDTLDLVERTRLGLNGLLGTVDPKVDYEPFFLTFFGANPPYFVHWSTMVSGVMPKYLEAIALLRNMSGVDFGKDIEEGIVDSLIENMKEDGLVYDRRDPRRPWNVGVGYGKKDWDEDYASVSGNGRLINGMYFYYQATRNEIWKERMKRTAERLYELAIFKDDYAYYPNPGCGNDFSYPKESGWTNIDEPKSAHEGAEGATLFHLSQPIRGLIKWYKISGDEKIFDLCKRLITFIKKPRFWGGLVEYDKDYGARRAHFCGHVHGTLATLRGMLEYGMEAEDYEVMAFVRDGYEWMRHNMCLQLGLDTSLEGCAAGDLTALGIQLSDYGMGNYWEDVDYVVRNCLAEAQTSDPELVKRIVDVAPKREIESNWGAPFDWRFSSGILIKALPGQECTDSVIERSIGGFTHAVNGVFQEPYQMHCCTANGNQGFYFAWEAVIRYDNGIGTINLLFNRYSPWADIESYIPYEGKVIVTNKTCRKIKIYIPAWARKSQVKCSVNGREIRPEWTGLYVFFSDLKPLDRIVVEFPLEIEKKTLLIPSVNGGMGMVRATFKGSTCIGIERGPNQMGMEPVWYPMYHGREKFTQDRAPMKEVEYHVVHKQIKWY